MDYSTRIKKAESRSGLLLELDSSKSLLIRKRSFGVIICIREKYLCTYPIGHTCHKDINNLYSRGVVYDLCRLFGYWSGTGKNPCPLKDIVEYTVNLKEETSETTE